MSEINAFPPSGFAWPFQPGKRLLTVQEFLAAYGLKRSKYYMLQAEGLGPQTIKIGRRTYIAIEDAEAWLNAQRSKKEAA
jgi:predicted DNA-binding transcriptional regulator AlpA